MKPGPAISALVISGRFSNSAAIFAARSRGLRPASLASTIAALVARSPCPVSRGGSTTMRDNSGAVVNTPALASASTALQTCVVKRLKTFMRAR